MKYPNKIISYGNTDKAIVRAIQKQLILSGISNVTVTGTFDSQTRSAVKLFQSLHRDAKGNPLLADGKVGPITWEILYGTVSVSSSDTTQNNYLKEGIRVALSQVGVMEDPIGSNRGAMVETYLASTNIPPGNFWCAAFVYWCFDQAAKNLGRKNPLVKTAGCLNHWNKTTGNKLLAAEAIQKPSLIRPGHIFIIDHGGGNGHTGIVQSVHGGFLSTIEGNSNPDGSNNGIGVFNLTNRKINSVNRGYILYK